MGETYVREGGETLITDINSTYMKAAAILLNHTIESATAGERLPLWGTCMGMQTLSVLVGGPAVLDSGVYKGVDPAMLPLTLAVSAVPLQM
jgi:GMP synthase-like glutamine amidotransferase